MKSTWIIWIVTLLTICQLFVLPCSAAQTISLPNEDMSLQLPDDFSVVTKDNLQASELLLKQYGTTVTETDVKFSQDHYLLLGLSQTMRCTMFLSKQTDGVSATIGDLISYNQPELARSLLLGKELPETVTVKEVERRGALFYRVDFGVTEGIGRIAYITVINGTAYTLCVVDNSGTLTANINAALDFAFDHWEYTIYAEAGKIQQFQNRIISAIRFICIPLLIIAAVFVVRWLMKDLHRRQLESDRRRITPKKPRR